MTLVGVVASVSSPCSGSLSTGETGKVGAVQAPAVQCATLKQTLAKMLCRVLMQKSNSCFGEDTKDERYMFRSRCALFRTRQVDAA